MGFKPIMKGYAIEARYKLPSSHGGLASSLETTVPNLTSTNVA